VALKENGRRVGPSISGRVRVAITLSHLGHLSRPGQADLLEVARAADRAGIDQLVVSEHVVLTERPVLHGGKAFPFPPDEEYPEPFVALAAIAAVTRRSRLSTNVLIAPFRPAVLLAKMAATLDVLSSGRFDLGVGVGWHSEEFAALGVSMHHRGLHLENTIQACQALWSGAPASFSSASVSFSDIYCSPRPRLGFVPVWFGGPPSEVTAQRVARLGAGWSVIGATPWQQVATGVRMIREACSEIGRDPREISVRVTLPIVGGRTSGIDEILSVAPDYLAAGANVLQLPPLTHFIADRREAEPFLRELMRTLPRQHA
jgi:probable F420-dependent oxidoreductase